MSGVINSLKEVLKEDLALTRERHPTLSHIFDSYRHNLRESSGSLLCFGLGTASMALGMDLVSNQDYIGGVSGVGTSLAASFLLMDSMAHAVDRYESRQRIKYLTQRGEQVD